MHPDCNFIDILEQHLERAHYGQPILKPVYDHSTGSLVRPEYVQPREFVIVEGLLGFHTAAMRQFYDVKVYLDPPEDLRRTWKIKRDTTKRGYTAEQVLLELDKRESDSARFIRPQREYADIVVRFYPPPVPSAEQADSHLNVQLVLRPTIPHPGLSYLFDQDSNRSGVRLELGRDDGRPVEFLKVTATWAGTMPQNWKTPSGDTSPTCARYGRTSSAITLTAWWSGTVIRSPSRNCSSHITCCEPTAGKRATSRVLLPLSADWTRRGPTPMEVGIEK